jgi:hypothetical protein
VLDELVAMRTAALGEVAGRMGPAERDALLRGTHAFHSARQAGHAAARDQPHAPAVTE